MGMGVGGVVFCVYFMTAISSKSERVVLVRV